MPIYKLNGDVYDIPQEKQGEFESQFPDAFISYTAGADQYDIPVSKRDDFLKDFPDAQLYSVSQPQVQETPIEDPYATTEVPMFDDEPNASLGETDAERGFGAGAREGWKGLKAGFQNLWGETANVFTGSSQDSINALNELNDMVRQGKDVAAETENAWTDAGREIRTGAMELLPGWMIKGWKDRVLARAEKEKVLDDIREALGEAGGDVDKARAILEQRAQEMSYGDEQIAKAAEKFADVKPTEGFGAWVGSNVVQMIPSASALIVGAVTKSPAAAKAIGMIGMGGMTAATAGTSMYEARQAGASDQKVWKVGITDGMIEYLTEKLPFDRYTSRIMGKVKGEVAQDLFSALRTNKATRAELENLLIKANERLGGKLFSKKNLKDYLADMLAEGASEFSAEALQTMTSMMYENPEDYPTINEILTNGWEGAKAGFFMGAVLGGASKTMEHTQNRKRRMDKGSVDVALVDFGDGEKDVAEVVEYDASSNTAVVLHDGSFEKVSGDAIADGYRFSYEEFENARLREMEDEAVVSGNVTEGQIQGLEDNIARDIEEIKALAPEMTESEISAILQSEMAVEPDTPLGAAVAKYQEDVARHDELVAAKREADAAKKEAIRTEIETAVGQRFWVQESGEDDGSGIIPVSETVEEVVYADGRVGYVVGSDESGNLTMVYTDGTKGFSSRAEITEKENSGEILSNTVMGLDDYLAVKMDIDEVTREKARMQEEHALSVEEMIATHPQGSVINVGTEEAKIEVPIIAPPTKDGVIVQMPDGTTPMLTWEDVAHAEKKEITPKTDAQLNQSIVDEYRVAYTPAVPASSQPTQQKEEQVKRTSPANPLPLKADGSVDQTALWNKDPEGWAQWNDEKRQDGGADSLAYVTNAIAIEQAKMAELQTVRSQETDFDRRDALDAEIATAQERINRLVAIQQGYLAQPAVADAVQNVQPEPEPQTEEERAAAEEQRREPFRKRAKELGEKLGVKINIAESLADVQEEQAREEIIGAEVSGSGARFPGWYNRDTGEVTIYLPHVRGVADIDRTIIHEVVAHKGLRGLLGKEGYNVLCDAVWDMMTEAERAKYMAYPGVNGDKRLAADEYIARFAEGLDLEQSRPIWNKIAEAVQKILNSMGIRLEVTKEDLADLIAASYMRLQEQARAAQTENAPVVEEVAEEVVPETTIEQQAGTGAGVEADIEEVTEESTSPIIAAAQQDKGGISFNVTTEEPLQDKIRKFAQTEEGKATGWTEDDIESIIAETESLIDAIHRSSTGNEFYDEFAYKEPTIRVDWRDGEAKPIVTWTRANIEYKYDMSADLLCINNEGLEKVLSSDKMVALMEMFVPEKKAKKGEPEIKFTSEDYLELYNTLKDLGFVVPCKGCFDAAGRFKMLPSVAQKFAAEVNALIDERNKDPKAFDEKLKAKPGEKTVGGLPATAATKSAAIAAGVAGDNLTEHVKWTQLMSADGQTKMLSDWGGIFRAWQRTGAGRPKDKLLPEPYYGDIVSSVSTIIGKYGEKTPSFRDTLVNQGTGLRRNSHSEFRPVLAIDEIQFMRDAFIRNLTVFKYMKELDDVRLFGKMGVKFNMSFFPEYVPGTKVAGLDKDGNYIASEESVGSREFPYQGEDGKRHYDGMKGWEEAQKHINKDVSLSSVIFSIPHLLKALTDVPTPSDMRGIWGSLIPFHSSGATTASLAMQGLGMARANGVGHGFSEAFYDYGKGVTNFEAVQNDRFGEGWHIVSGTKAGTDVEPGHKLEFVNGNHYYNKALGVHLFASGYILDSELPAGVLGENGELDITNDQKKALMHKFTIDYNDKVRELKGPYAYKDAADFYIAELPKLGLIPRFDFEVSEEKFLEMCEAANVDPRHPKLGWKGEGNSWSPIDSEAYYSLFCDYGMTDPATGEWAPHMPVGYVNEEGEREFRLPDNAVEIVKEGLDRFSGVRRSENARIDEAIETFAERSVEKGRISQKSVDKVLGKKSVPTKPAKPKKSGVIDLVEEAKKAVEKTSNISFSFIGERGAANDKTLEGVARLDNLETARQMESQFNPDWSAKENEAALKIKIATGWERGADGKWRYEVEDVKAKPAREWLTSKKKLTLKDIVEPNPIFDLYPDLLDINIVKDRSKYNLGAYYSEAENSIKLPVGALKEDYTAMMDYYGEEKADGNFARYWKVMESDILHELQHAIQHREGFALGGSPDGMFPEDQKRYNELYDEMSLLIDEYNKIPYYDRLMAYAVDARKEAERAKIRVSNFHKAHQIGEYVYKRLAGEVEARNASKRRDMSPEERRNTLLAATEDVARKDQIFLMDAVAGDAQNNISFRMTTEMKEIKEKAQADGTFMKAPNGQPTNLTEEQWLMVRTKNFINWFGDWENDPENASKVVDENGEPKVVYHQTNQKIFVNRETGENWDELGWKEKMEWDNRDDWEDYWEEQDFNTFSRVNARTTNEFDGFFFAPEYDEYHEYGDRTIAAFVNIKNPASREDYNIDSRYNDAGRNERIRLQEAGFDGVIRMDGDNVDEYIAFEPNQIKSATDNNGDFNPKNNNISFRVSNENQAIFVSNAARAVEGIKMEKATPEQWLKMLEKAGGLKAGEDKWMGLSDWLKASDKKTLTKQEVLDFINEHMIVIEEQHYSNDPNIDKKLFEEFDKKYPGNKKAFIYEYDDYREKPYVLIDNLEAAVELYNANHEDKVELDEFDSLSLADEKKVEEFGNQLAKEQYELLYYGEIRSINSTRLQYTTEGLNNNHEIALTVPTIESWNEGDDTHFGDAGEGRAVAWIRFGDASKWVPEQREDGKKGRTKKVLVIDEIQSKRHQEGREKGYKTQAMAERAEAYRKLLDAHDKLYDRMLEKYGEQFDRASSPQEFESMMSPEDFNALNASRQALNDVRVEMQKEKHAIPDAPFDKNWHELAMKRMLRYAAENGYDVIAWTKGEQQAERYGIGKVVSSVVYRRTEDGKRVRVNMRGGESLLFDVDVLGKVTEVQRDGGVVTKGMPLSEIVGSNLANQIGNYEGEVDERGDYNIKSEDFRIGGEGMRGFYDRMLPAFMNKYGKKWGVKVEDIELPNLEEAGRVMHSVPVTEEMKASVMGGQVMFRMRTEEEDAMEFQESVLEEFKQEYRLPAPTTVVDVYDRDAVANALGYAPEKFTDAQYDFIMKGYQKGGVSIFDPETKRIAIFAKETLNESWKMYDCIFHENTHFLVAEHPDLLELGEWLWQNSEPLMRKTIKEHILANDTYKGYETDEMLSGYTGVIMATGKADVAYAKTPEELRKHWDLIFNAFGYGRKTEDNPRRRGTGNNTGRVESSGNRADASAEQKHNDAAKQELTAEERRVIGEYFPEFNKSEDVRMKVNSQGKDLTEGQKEFFANSKAVDKDGNLLVLYHGTPRAGFTEFKSGWFTTSKEDAISYSGDRKGRLFNPNEKYEPETLVAGDFRLGHMTFDSEEDRAAFLAKYSSAESAMSRIDFDLMTMQAEDEEYDALIERKPELQKIWNAYREYERERFVDTTIDELLDNPDAYTEDDFRRAILAYDSNAIFDEIDEIEDSAERKDALVEALEYMKNDAAENGGFIGDMKVATRIPRNGEGVSHNDSNARTYEAYINIEHPLELDAAGRHSEFESGDIYKAVEEALSDEQYDGVIIRNWRVGRYQQLGDVVVPKDGNQIKLTSNENPTKSHNVSFRFIGEKGAEALDKAEEATVRLDNLTVARQMEEAGKDAGAIKLATGWERGADDLWRYETADFSLKPTWINATTLEEAIKDDELFKAYPELRKTKVRLVHNSTDVGGKFSKAQNSIEAIGYSFESMQDALVHEVQHAIQEQEGFEGGGNPMIANAAVAMEWANKYAAIYDNSPLKKANNAYSDTLDIIGMMDDLRQLRTDRKNSEKIKDTISTILVRLEKLQNYLPAPELKKEFAQRDLWPSRIWDTYAWLDNYQGYIIGLEDSESITDEERKAARIKELMRDSSGMDAYHAITGEVEARNATKRRAMSYIERRQSLASETEDVAREDHLFINGALEELAKVMEKMQKGNVSFRTSLDLDEEFGDALFKEESTADENGVSFRVVTDSTRIEELEDGPKVEAYRAVQIDKNGKIYSPMASRLKSTKKGTKQATNEAAQMNQWDEAVESPDKVDENGRITILNEDGGTTKVAYNPYGHCCVNSMMNDQFKRAWERDGLYVMKVLAPESELTAGYHAEKAKDAVGIHKWKTGAVGNKLPENKRREILLTRWMKNVKVMPWEEVAQDWIKTLEGENIDVPFNVVPRKILNMLAEAGVKIVAPEKGMENATKAYEQWLADPKGYVGNTELPDHVKALNEETDDEGPDNEPRFRTTGTSTDEVVANGLTLTPAQTAEVAANIFAALPEESRKKITDGLNGNILGLKDAILQIPTSLATKENWNEEDRAMADVVAEEMTKMAGEMTRPFSAPEALWLLYNNLNKGNDLISQASRALVQRNLGFDEETLERQEEAKRGVSFRMVGDATANAKASIYNRGAVNVWTRLKESFVDMQASVEELVSAIEKATGKVAKGFENILLALNQQSSKGLAAMESYEQRFLMPMFDEVRKIMDKAYAGYDTVVRYVILKHGLERNKKLAQRDAKAHYQETYDEMIAKVNSMDDSQKRTYLTNAQLQDADAKAKLATLKAADTSAFTEEEKNAHKRELAKAKEEVKKAKENLERAQKINSMSEQELKDELDKIFEKIENGTDSVYKELRKNDYSGISSMFYDQLGVNRKDYSTEEEYQAALMLAKNDRFSSLEEVETQAEGEVSSFEGRVDTKELWKRINAATKETLRQQYEANMISKDQYESLRNMFEYYVPLRGFKDNTAEDMYTYYRKPNSTGYTKPILGAEGRKTEAESPFGWIAAMAGSAIASNVKNEAKLALYYFVSNRPNNGIATLSRTWFVHTPGDVDANGKKIFKPAYPPFSEDLSSDAAKQAYEDWQEQMRELQKQGLAYEAGQRLNLGNAVVNISDANKPEHVVTVKVAGKDYTIVINGNPRAAQAINGELNIESTADDYSAIFGPVLRWMSSVNTSYNPEFWITNLMRDMAFTWMAVNTKEDPAYRKKFSKNYWKCFRVIGLVAKNEKGTIGNSYIEDMYKDFVKYGGVTGYTQIKDSETWEKEIDNYLSSTSPESLKNGKMMRGMKTFFHAAHRFGESLEQVSRFAAFLTSREMGKTINEAIEDAKEITVNFNRKGSGKMITLEESKYLTDKNGQPLSLPARWAAVGLSSIAPLGRRTIMFFNAAVQGLNSVYRLWKKNPKRLAGWTAAYFAFGVLNAAIHALLDDDDDYLDIPQYERRNSLMLGGNGAYLKWALPQEARAFYALGDLAVESVLGRNPHQNVVGEAMKIATEVLPVNPTEGWKAFVPSVAIPAVELMLNEDYKGAPIYNEQKWLSKEERERTAKWSSAYQGTGTMYKGIAQGLNYITGGDKHDAGKINLQPEKMEHIVQSAFGGTIRTADKFINTIWAMFDPEEDVTVRQTPFLNRILTINDERFKNVHVNEVFDYYKADADHALTLEKKYRKDRDQESLNELRRSDEYQWAKVYRKYKKALDNLKEKLKVAEGTAERKELMRQQDELKRRVIKEISEL